MGAWNISSGSSIIAKGSAGASFNGSAWHQLQLSASGTNIMAMIDGTKVASVSDSSNRAGWVGLGTDSFSIVQFDNFSMNADFASGGWCGQGNNVAAGGCWSGQPNAMQQWKLSTVDGTLRLAQNASACLTVDKSTKSATVSACLDPPPATQIWLYNESIQALQSSSLCLGTVAGSANLCAVATMNKVHSSYIET